MGNPRGERLDRREEEEPGLKRKIRDFKGDEKAGPNGARQSSATTPKHNTG